MTTPREISALLGADGALSLTTDRQVHCAWNYFVGATTGLPAEEWPAAALRAAQYAATTYPAAPGWDVSDTEETCASCRHSVENEQHHEGCSVCACPLSLLPDAID